MVAAGIPSNWQELKSENSGQIKTGFSNVTEGRKTIPKTLTMWIRSMHSGFVVIVELWVGVRTGCARRTGIMTGMRVFAVVASGAGQKHRRSVRSGIVRRL